MTKEYKKYEDYLLGSKVILEEFIKNKRITEDDVIELLTAAIINYYREKSLFNRGVGSPEYALERHLDGELNLDAEWIKQASRLADLYSSKLGVSREDYIGSLPKFKPKPKSFDGKFDIPLIVQTPTQELTLSDMFLVLDIKNSIPDLRISHWSNQPSDLSFPYTAWVNDGTGAMGMNVDSVREIIKSNPDSIRACSIYDGLALYAQYPEVLNQHAIDFPDMVVKSQVVRRFFQSFNRDSDLSSAQYCLSLTKYEQTAVLSISITDTSVIYFGSMLAGREIDSV